MWEDQADEAQRNTGLTDLDEQLERLEKILGVAEQALTPVLHQYDSPDKVLSEPRPQPQSQLRGRAERLRDLNAQFDRLLSRLDI